jgi:Salmonella virulence plasmid 65kDa B protein
MSNLDTGPLNGRGWFRLPNESSRVAIRGRVAPMLLLTAAGAAFGNGTHTGHQFSVTETGAATISIPIQVPRGIGGMEPQLSLNYSSGAGNGALGVGWMLAGPSAITRCPKSMAQDGVRGTVAFGKADRFCLDGQRLLSDAATTDDSYGAAGTIYSTERESFSRVTALSNYAGQAGVPASFEVKTKAGLILEFGLSPNSQVLTKPTDSTPPTINRWLLQRISDRMLSPSYVEFVYCAGEIAADMTCNTTTFTGSQVLHYIRYSNRGATLNGTAAVMFGYEARPDRQLTYHAGTSQVQTQRVSFIATYLGFTSPTSPGDRIKVYELTYDTMKNSADEWTRVTNVSRITRIQELRGGVASVPRPPPLKRPATDALPPLDFTYAADRLYGQAVSQDPVAAGPGTVAPRPLPSCGGYMAVYRRTQLCP